MDEPIADLLRSAAAVYVAAYLMGMRVTSRLTVALAPPSKAAPTPSTIDF